MSASRAGRKAKTNVQKFAAELQGRGKGAAKKPAGEEKVRTMMQMPADLYGKIQTLVAKQKTAGDRGASLSSVVTEALEEYFKGRDM